MIGKEEDSEKMYHNADNAKCKTELRQLRTHAEEKKWEKHANVPIDLENISLSLHSTVDSLITLSPRWTTVQGTTPIWKVIPVMVYLQALEVTVCQWFKKESTVLNPHLLLCRILLSGSK